MFREVFAALAAEFRSIDVSGRRGLESLAAAGSVALAVIIAFWWHSDQPWWAAISAFMVARSSLAEALLRAVMRIIGSAIGAALGVVVLGLFAYEPVPFCLCLFAMAWAGLFGFSMSRFGYAWLMGGITGTLVTLIGLDQPPTAFMMACDRVIDVAIGTVASLLVTALLPDPMKAAASPAPTAHRPLPLMFWSRRHAAELERWLRDNWPIILHASRGGLTVMLLPALAASLSPLSPTSIGITAVAVLAVPTTAVTEPDARTIINRALYRLLGCLCGALVGLICLGWGVGDDFAIWLLVLIGGVWLCWQIQSGSTGIGYAGTQAGLAFLMSIVQGRGPPLSITPGIDRLAGISVGLSLLLVITMVVSLFQRLERPAMPTSGD